MNKVSIATAVALASIAFASAEGTTTIKRPLQIKPQVVKQMIKQEGRDVVMPNIKTGDPALDAQIKALNIEMETKIKAIRDEYVLKLKAIVASRATSTATTTPRVLRGDDMPGQREGMDEGRKLGVPFTNNASSTATGTMPRPFMRVENKFEQNESGSTTSRVMNFFRGMFGGNR